MIPYNSHITTLCTAASVTQNGTLQLYNEDCGQQLPSWCESAPPTTESNTRGPRIVIRPIPPGNHGILFYSLSSYMIGSSKFRKLWQPTLKRSIYAHYKPFQNSFSGNSFIHYKNYSKVSKSSKRIIHNRKFIFVEDIKRNNRTKRS